MPTARAKIGGTARTFDARPDRVDFRDLPYRAPLRSLPREWPSAQGLASHFKSYCDLGLVRDQGEEGACTGFGLMAVVNYLLFRRHLGEGGRVESVSPRMLYQMARAYDEWPGADYDGSSCRGAMKGWHRHGVTTEKLWPYEKNGVPAFVRPDPKWQADAAQRPLGAYYRIDKDSLSDMQAAIYEVGAIYCSADVHDGWGLSKTKSLTLIPYPKKKAGGHAFALVGYTPDGFIVQNSWGPDWGYRGFAILSYEDWVANGADAWAAVLGAPVRVASPRTRVARSLTDDAGATAARELRARASYVYHNPKCAPLSEEEARLHTIVLGNDGRVINDFLDHDHADSAVDEVSHAQPKSFFASHSGVPPRLMIYAHGGLNAESASIERIRVMAPYFRENGIHPLFITWKTGFLESIQGIIADAFGKLFGMPAEGIGDLLDELEDKFAEGRDRAIEAACENLLVKPVWTQMKQNADAAEASGLALLVSGLAKLAADVPKLEIHLVGHSAGSLVLGHLLHELEGTELSADSLSLYAPACTVAFANRMYPPAVAAGKLAGSIHFDVLSDERELADTVGPYGKSLLFLVSRALETVHKMPLLGMQRALDKAVEAKWKDAWNEATKPDLAAWRKFAAAAGVTVRVHGREREQVSTGPGKIPLAHGSFDNDVEVITQTLQRIRGKKTLDAEVENLEGF